MRNAPASQVAGAPLPLADLPSASIERATDGWHVVLRIQGERHYLWLKQAPQSGAFYSAELPFDADFEIRAYASHRLWRAINGHPPGPPYHQLSPQQRERLTLALRALDGYMDGASYRVIAEVLFGKQRLPGRGWKTHDLRSRTIRLVQAGRSLVRGGYRALLRPTSRKE